MSNLYHILHRLPAFDRDQMQVDLEQFAVQLVQSGRLRIDAGAKQNFARLTLPRFHATMTFSERELTDPKLLPLTQQVLTHIFKAEHRGDDLARTITFHIDQMRETIRKAQPVDPKLELRLARILVQSAHPIVIALLLLERVEIYVSYSYTIGDVLDVMSWQSMGDNSGMQSTDGHNAAIFVSCGGDPFDVTEPGRIYGDGFPALARMMVIAGQEIGHYSDIKRDRLGRQASRYSANFAGTRATEHVRLGRLSDIVAVDQLRTLFTSLGMEQLVAQEHKIRFYKKQKTYFIRRSFLRLYHWLLLRRFVARAHGHGVRCISDFLFHPYPLSYFVSALADMRFNLAPQADVYRRKDPQEEEAIACIEALARIPQQVNKWGYRTTQAMMPSLYHIYYREVIPGCMQAYEALTKHPFVFSRKRYRRPLWKFLFFWRREKTLPKKIAIYE